jgi:putative peptidoglycan lipid II flippase
VSRFLARSAGLISLATMLSRVLGLVREQLFAALLGATAFADAFLVAFRIPNLLRDLFAEGALSQAFVPTFKSALKHSGRGAAYDLANRIAGTLFTVIGLIVLAGAIFAPQIAGLLADGFAPAQLELTVLLTRIMLPFLAVISLAAVAMGMLNAQNHYAWPALAPATFNVVSIATGLLLYLAGVEGRWVAIGWSIGTVAGGLAQLGIQLPSLLRIGYRLRPRLDLLLKDPGVRRVALLMLPAVGGLAAVQINIVVNTILATSESGAVSWLNYSFRFLQLPIGVFGVAIATVSTTRYADAAADGDRAQMADLLEQGLRLVAFLTVPATVGLLLLSEPIIRLTYERGLFRPEDTVATARALELFVVGLVAYAAIKVTAPAFYAVNRARVPMIASFIAVAGNVTLSLSLFPVHGYRVLALGIAVAALANFTVLYIAFHISVARVRHLRLLLYLLRVCLAAAAMGALVWASHRGLAGWLGESGLGARAAVALIPVTAGAIAYAALCALLRVEEVHHYLGRLRRRR